MSGDDISARPPGPGGPRRLFDPNILDKISNVDDFLDEVVHFYLDLAKEWGCALSLSERRLREVHQYWRRDRDRALTEFSERPEDVDHFKHASFIAYWLRRFIPINDIWLLDEKGELANAVLSDGSDPPSDRQLHFVEFGNELCALWAGFYICLSYEMATYKQTLEEEVAKNVGVHVLHATIKVDKLPGHFQNEYPRLLKQKNMSPQSLYVLYRSLFDRIIWKPLEDAA